MSKCNFLRLKLYLSRRLVFGSQEGRRLYFFRRDSNSDGRKGTGRLCKSNISCRRELHKLLQRSVTVREEEKSCKRSPPYNDRDLAYFRLDEQFIGRNDLAINKLVV